MRKLRTRLGGDVAEATTRRAIPIKGRVEKERDCCRLLKAAPAARRGGRCGYSYAVTLWSSLNVQFYLYLNIVTLILSKMTKT